MTVLAGGVFLIFTFVLGTGLALVGSASALDARAQLAADAAALAAVAEASGPGGTGMPEAAAHLYAEANGARVVECICAPGSLAVQVSVAVDDVLARARAEFDPSLLKPLSGVVRP